MADVGDRSYRLSHAKRWLPVLAPIIGSALALAALFRLIDVGAAREAVGSADQLPVAGAALLGLPYALLKSWKWRRLAVRAIPEATYVQAVRSYLIGVAASLVTPGRLGELTRAACFPRRRKELLALTVADKFIDVGVLCVLCAAAAWSYSPRLGLLALAGITLAVGVVWYARRRQYPLANRLRVALPAREIAANAAVSTACYLLLATQFHLVLSSTGTTPAEVSFSAVPPIVLGSSMPLFFSGFGSREAIAVALLGAHGISAERATVAGLLLFAVCTPLPALAGIALAALPRSR
jgi:glycosyltransferase 2 family protein